MQRGRSKEARRTGGGGAYGSSSMLPMDSVPANSPRRTVSTLEALFQHTPSVVLVVAVLLLVLDLVLFVDHRVIFGADPEEPPLPHNDFNRIVAGLKPPKSLENGSGYELHKHTQKESEKGDPCKCDPLEYPSRIIKCSLSSTGAQQLKVVNGARTAGLQFQCAHLHDEHHKRIGCQCCDCGTEDRRIVFKAQDIVDGSESCLHCESPGPLTAQGAVFDHGSEIHQLLFKLPLDVQHDAEKFRVSLEVDGVFNKSLDADVMVGVLDARTGVVWLGQRGDNGMWFSVGKSLLRTVNTRFDKLDSRDEAVVQEPPKVSIYEPHELKFFKKGSRSSKFGMKISHSNEGAGFTKFSMDNNMLNNGGIFGITGSWTAKGWKVKRQGSSLKLYVVAYRDDVNEVYVFNEIRAHYKKLG